MRSVQFIMDFDPIIILRFYYNFRLRSTRYALFFCVLILIMRLALPNLPTAFFATFIFSWYKIILHAHQKNF